MPDSEPEEFPEPSAGRTRARAIFSTRASLLVALFGGPFAVLVFTALHSQRLGRFTRDLWALAFAVLVAAIFIWWATVAVATQSAPAWMTFLGEGSRGLHVAGRLLALTLAAAMWMLHRRFHGVAAARAAKTRALWIAAIASVIAGSLLSAGLAVAALSANGLRS